MKVYLQTDEKGIPIDYDHYSAGYGFGEMGFEIVKFNNYEQLKTSKLCDVIVGYGKPIETRLKDFGINIPNIDYPNELTKYLGRKIWKSTINTINNNPDLWGVFVKPINRKAFSGRVVNSSKDLIGCGLGDKDQDVYVSEVLDFVSEYRVFVRYGSIIDMRHYNGDWSILPDVNVIPDCIKDYVNGPKTYAIDFGVTKNNVTNLIEVNVSGSIGSYGLEPIMYAKFMSARWSELTCTRDECDFDLF